jgi:hypothetical protein
VHHAGVYLFVHSLMKTVVIEKKTKVKMCIKPNLEIRILRKEERTLLGSCFGAPKVSHEEAASADVVSKRWPKVPFHGASAF